LQDDFTEDLVFKDDFTEDLVFKDDFVLKALLLAPVLDGSSVLLALPSFGVGRVFPAGVLECLRVVEGDTLRLDDPVVLVRLALLPFVLILPCFFVSLPFSIVVA